ncbi:MAG TPA: hypothetical protein DCE42_09765 [Myxococcales bacterium]|nr:hypothetical protein [Deltaproteobacteria bacterium]HAA55034.1 hypothetical protein [Myxococcales bacterium]
MGKRSPQEKAQSIGLCMVIFTQSSTYLFQIGPFVVVCHPHPNKAPPREMISPPSFRQPPRNQRFESEQKQVNLTDITHSLR